MTALIPATLLAFAAMVLTILWPKLPVLADMRPAMAGLTLLTGGLLLLFVLIRAGATRFVLLPLLMLVAAPVFFGHGLRPVNIAAQLSAPLAALPENAVLAARRFQEPSLVYYTNRRWNMLPNSQAMTTWSEQNKDRTRVVVTLDQEAKLDRFLKMNTWDRPEEAGRSFAEEHAVLTELGFIRKARFEGFNTARSTWVVVSWWLAGD